MPGDLGCTCGDYARVLCFILHAGLWVRRAPGIPHALCYLGAPFMHSSGASRRGNADLNLKLAYLRFAQLKLSFGCLKVESETCFFSHTLGMTDMKRSAPIQHKAPSQERPHDSPESALA